MATLRTTRFGTCVSNGCLCCYSGCDLVNVVVCCIGECDCLCLRHASNCSCHRRPLGCGMTTDKSKGEYCKIACNCCDLGCIKPTKLCTQAQQSMCCFSVGSCPQDTNYVSKNVCAVLCIQCYPLCGCCFPSPECKALDVLIKKEPPPTALAMEH